MKHMKKLVSVLLTLVMALALTIPAFAANVTNSTNHSYKAYQIFSGTQADNSAPLGDVEWGSGINGEAFLRELKTDARFVADSTNIFASSNTAKDVAAVLGGYTDSSEVAKAFANVAAKHLTTTATDIASDATSVSMATGYYLLVDTSPLTGEGAFAAHNSALLQVTNKGDITIAVKYSVPTVDKGIVKGADLVEADDVNIGDDVTFRLTGTLPTNYADYETYKYVFHDTLSTSLAYKGDAKVYLVNDSSRTDITANFIISHESGVLTISCNNLKAISAVSASSEIVVEYTAELTKDAVIGSAGNKNDVYLEYSNDPNQTGSGNPTTSNTPKDEVLVFTYELDVTKVDGQDATKKLKDAEFVLLSSDKNKVAKVADGKFVEWVADDDITKNADGSYPAEYTLKSAETTGLFKIAGLDAGTYYLKETKAPAGYNLLKDVVKIEITATLNKSEDSPALTALTIKVNDGTATDGTLETGVVATNVVNNAGATLPETGGMGTTLFYVLGTILVLGAGVLLVSKKRMSSGK